jgi:hypothetical protein
MYWGASEEHSSGRSGTTPGFLYDNTNNQNTFTYNPMLSPSVAYAPSAVESPADVSTSVAVIFVAS